MAIEIKLLNRSIESEYKEFLENCDHAMLYHSLNYRDFLKAFLTDSAKDYYLLAFNQSKLIGALPTFIMNCDTYGNVLNSLPFYGSHGSILLSRDAPPETSNKLLSALKNLCLKFNISLATIVDNPFNSYQVPIAESLSYDFTDQRIGQITNLPDHQISGLEEKLFSIYHSKTRNIVRKSLKNNLIFGHENSLEALEKLHKLHDENLKKIGGIAKPFSFFSAVSKTFKYDDDYRLYTAKTIDGEIVCGLLLLYFKNHVEYFVPATLDSWKNAQPLSGLIHYAMLDACNERGSRIWNWGGTWLTQDSVYHFKSRWGTKDLPYYYYTRNFKDQKFLNDLDRVTLQQNYPWFYTLPFSALKNEN